MKEETIREYNDENIDAFIERINQIDDDEIIIVTVEINDE